MERNKTKHIANVSTRRINWEKDIFVDQYLIGDALAISDDQIRDHQMELVRDITYPDWSLAFRIVRTNPGFEFAKLEIN